MRGENLHARYRRPQEGGAEKAQARQRPSYFMPNHGQIIHGIAGACVDTRPVLHHPSQHAHARDHANDESDRRQGQLIIANRFSRRQ